MNIACVMGNGPSRKQFDLDTIHATMYTYGCNALYRDFLPDYLVSMDFYVVDEILQKNVHKKCKFYTQHKNRIDKLAEDGEPINFFWGQPMTHDSGTSAIELAAESNDVIYMIGFDYMQDDKLPNIYHGTTNYASNSNIPAADDLTNRWKTRLRSVVKKFDTKKFIRVNGSNTEISIQQTNYSEITPEQFKETYDPRT